MIIHLNENIFHRLFLTEATTEEIYQKYYTDIPYVTYCQILQLDPTSVNGRMGRYSKWLLNIYRKGTFKEGDFGEAKKLLPIFDRYKNVLPVKDIMTLHSMGELYRVVQPYMSGDQATSKSDAARRTKEGAEKVYEDNQWLIVIPHTMEAAQLYGKHTQWCTAAEKSDNMFDYYNNEGYLFINIDKVNNRKYQFHFESGQFMNENDEPIFVYDDDGEYRTSDVDSSMADLIGMPQGVRNYYKGLFENGNDNAIIVIVSPKEFLQVLINDEINTSRYNMDIVDNEPVKPGEIGLIRIFGWYTYVKYRRSYVVESQLFDGWYKSAENFANVIKPIRTKTGITNKVASVMINDDSDYMAIDDKGEFISDRLFHSPLTVAPNGYAVAKYIPDESTGEIMYNIFDLNDNCKPVFKTPYYYIDYNNFMANDGIQATAAKYVGDAQQHRLEYFKIDIFGREYKFDESNWESNYRKIPKW